MNRPARRFIDIIGQLDKVVQEASVVGDEKRKDILLSFVVVKLDDQWNFRSRQIVLLSYGRSEERMRECLQHKWTGTEKRLDQDWEPSWHVPSDTIKAARLLSVPDYVHIRDAIGSVTYVDDIRWTRNAVVHNVPATFDRYKHMALDRYQIANVMPCRLLLETNPATENTIYEDWCDELRDALQLALQ